MLKKRFEIEVTHSQKFLIEVDPSKFCEKELNNLLGTKKDLSHHIAEVANVYTKKKLPGVYGQYGLVLVDGDAGGKMMRRIAPDSGVNILPIFDDADKKYFSVTEIESVQRAKPANANG